MKKFIALILTVALIVPIMSINALTPTDWLNMFKDASHTNYQPDANIPDVMQRNWVYYPEGSSIFSHVTKGDKVYLGDSAGFVVCLDQSTGEELWKYEVGTKGMITIGITGEKISFLCEVDNTPKKEEGDSGGPGGGRGGRGGGGGGRHPMSTSFETFSVAEDGQVNNIIGFISLENGAELYKKSIVEPESIAAGLVTDEYVYLAYSQGLDADDVTGGSRIVCMNPEDNSEVWSLDYKLLVQNLFTAGDEKLFISALKAKINEANPMMSEVLESSLVAFTLDGKIAWEKELTPKERVGMISYSDGVIYYPFMRMSESPSMREMPPTFIVAADAKTGDTKWEFALKEFEYEGEKINEGIFYGSPAITDYGLVVQCVISHTICLGKDAGNLKWVNETPGGFAFTSMQMACSKDKIVSSRGSKFSIAKSSTGEIIFTDDTKMPGGMPLPGRMPIMPIPIIANDKVFISGDRLICYGEKVIGLYSDPMKLKINQIYPDETKKRKVKVFYNDTGEIDGSLTVSEGWIKLSSYEYKTLSQTYEVTLSAVGLEPGVYNGTIDVKSTVGDLSIPVEMNVVPKPPIKLEISLEDKTITNENPFKVFGATAPGATVTVNGKPITVKTDGSFKDEIPIKFGANELKFHAEDDKGNVADITKIVILDDKKPTIRVNLKDNTKIVQFPFEFEGMTEPGSKLLVNDEPVEVATNGEFTVVLEKMENGEQTILMIAVDKAGNKFKLEINVIVDAGLLPLELDLPAPGFAGSKEKAYTLTGKTAPQTSVYAMIEDMPVGRARSDAEGKFQMFITVAEDGMYDVTVIAKTDDGKSSSPAEFKLVVDSTPPVIECIIPEIVNESPLKLTGKTEPMTKVFVNDKEATVDQMGNFTAEIELKAGLNSITIKAIDMLENESIIEGYIKFEEKAAVKPISMKLWVNQSKFVVDGKEVTPLDPMPTNQSPPLPSELVGNSYMPVRAVFEAMGADVQWINDDRRVDIRLGDVFLQLWVDNVSTAKVNGKDVTILGADGKTVLFPTIVAGRTMLPLRFACETLGAEVGWNAEERAITVVYPAP